MTAVYILDDLLAAGQSLDATKHRVRLFFAEIDTPICLAVYEGEDDKDFYESALSDYRIVNWEYRCVFAYGKPSVIALLNWVEELKRDGDLCLFFVDKDHDDFINNQCNSENLFVTEYYSLENFIVDKFHLEIILRDFFGFRSGSKEIIDILDLFSVEYEVFCRNMRSFMAWMIAVRNRGIVCDWNSVEIWRYFAASASGNFCRRKGGLKAALPRVIEEDTQCLGCGEVLATSRVIASINEKKYIRGKFELYFFCQFIKRQQKIWRKTLREDGGKISIPFDFGPKSIFKLMKGKFRYPDLLLEFLTQKFGKQ